jgi:hypothetical protein
MNGHLATLAGAVPGPPPRGAAVTRYLACHGAWHLLVSGRHADTLTFLQAVLASDSLEGLLGPAERTAALACGLAALESCPEAVSDALPAATILPMVVLVQDRHWLKGACELLSRRSLEELEAAFRSNPNPSGSAIYVLAHALARSCLDAPDTRRFLALHAAASDPESAIQYSALYAFKHACMLRPDWLDPALLRPFALAGPYDRLVATTLLMSLTLRGHRFALTFDVPEFWSPRWRYNAEEIALLRGAMCFKGLRAPEGDADQEALKHFNRLEALRQDGLAAGWQPLELLSDYWDLGNVPEGMAWISTRLRSEETHEQLLWLLLASPYWEVSETAASLAARWAVTDPRWLERLRRWSTSADTASWWGAAAALRLYEEKTGDIEPFAAAVAVQTLGPQAQLRGNIANQLQTLFSGAGRARQRALFVRFEPFLRRLLHGDDIWEVDELLTLTAALERQGYDWETALSPDSAPLLRSFPEWRTRGTRSLGNLLTQRDRAANPLPCSGL